MIALPAGQSSALAPALYAIDPEITDPLGGVAGHPCNHSRGCEMSKGNTFENDFLKLILNATGIPNIADNAASSPLTQLWLSLHTADPGEAGDQTTNECSYGSYARIGVNRGSGGFTVTNNVASLAANVDFPAASSGSQTATHFAVGTASSGTGNVLWSGPIKPVIAIASGVTPRLTTGTTIVEE